MADPNLTTLCTVCRAEPPRYKCPRCGARTCSLACVRRHKAWAECSGLRDVTAFVPRSRLRTPAGIDHDYNFLSSIERARRATEREVVEEKGLLRERDLRFEGGGPGSNNKDRRFREEWHGDELRFVPNTRGGGRFGGHHRHHHGAAPAEEEDGGADLSVAKRKVRTTCRRMGIELLSVPKGLSRHKENYTAWNKRTGRLNWQIEWLVYEDGSDHKATRILRKALDEEPIYRAFAATMEWLLKTQDLRDSHDGHEEDDEAPRKKRKRAHSQTDASAQSAASSTWLRTTYPTQNPITGAWEQESGYEIAAWARDVKFEEKKAMQYFLLKPKTSPKELIPIAPTDSLSTILPGRAVLEFPTIFALLAGAELPAGHVLGSTERKEVQPVEEQDLDEPSSRSGSKREFPSHRGGRGGTRGRGRGRGGRYETDDRQSNGAKRRKIAEQDGEVHSDRQAGGDEDDTTSSDDSSSEDNEDSLDSEDGNDIDMDGGNHAPEQDPVGKPGLVAYGSSSEDED